MKKGVSPNTMLFQPEIAQALCRHCAMLFYNAPRRMLNGYTCTYFISV